MTDPTPQEGELILYRTADDAVRVEVIYESECFWLDQWRMTELFGVEVPTVRYHLKEVHANGELTPEATLREIWRVQREGDREVRREIEFYNLDAMISFGYGIAETLEIADEIGIDIYTEVRERVRQRLQAQAAAAP